METEHPNMPNYQYLNRLATQDILEGILKWHLWYRMAALDIRRRYRRTVFGPFWTTLSMAIFIFSMGFVFAALWGMDVSTYIPYLTTGFIAWMPLNSVIMESATGLVSAAGIVTQVRMPYTVFAVNIVARNVMVMGHHLLVYALVALVFIVDFNGLQVLVIPALFLFCINGIWVSLLIGTLCARYRDITPLLGNVMQISMFITPIFWPPEQLGNRPIATLLIDFNPLYHFVNIFRAPLLGEMPAMLSYMVVLGITVAGWILTVAVFSRCRHRIIYWL